MENSKEKVIKKYEIEKKQYEEKKKIYEEQLEQNDIECEILSRLSTKTAKNKIKEIYEENDAIKESLTYTLAQITLHEQFLNASKMYIVEENK